MGNSFDELSEQLFGDTSALTAIITIISDIDAFVTIDGMETLTVNAGVPKQIECIVGQHIFLVVSQTYSTVCKQIVQNIDTPRTSYLVTIKLSKEQQRLERSLKPSLFEVLRNKYKKKQIATTRKKKERKERKIKKEKRETKKLWYLLVASISVVIIFFVLLGGFFGKKTDSHHNIVTIVQYDNSALEVVGPDQVSSQSNNEMGSIETAQEIEEVKIVSLENVVFDKKSIKNGLFGISLDYDITVSGLGNCSLLSVVKLYFNDGTPLRSTDDRYSFDGQSAIISTVNTNQQHISAFIPFVAIEKFNNRGINQLMNEIFGWDLKYMICVYNCNYSSGEYEQLFKTKQKRLIINLPIQYESQYQEYYSNRQYPL